MPTITREGTIMPMMEIILSILIGLALSATCGFRVFVPIFIMALGARCGHIELNAEFSWITSNAALISLGIATAAEIAAYYIPAVDHVLDVIMVPAAAIAGIIATAGMVTDVSPWLQWSLALIGGGGAATAVHAVMASVRAASSATTAGLANPVVHTAETIIAGAISFLTPFFPIIGIIFLAALVGGIIGLWRVLKQRQRTQAIC